jgi:PAS domain S-box-containing protein
MNGSQALIPILIVDDNPENLLVHHAVLRNPERMIMTAESGPEALELMKHHEFAVILLDIQMPVMDGFEVARRIQKMNLETQPPIIFVTAGMNELHMTLSGYAVGAVDYLFKPVEPDILRAKVEIFVQLFKARLQIKKQAEQLRVHDQQERDSFLENALDAVVAMNESGAIIYWNKQAQVIFGWKKDEALGSNFFELLIPDYDKPNPLGPMLKKRVEITGIRKDGTEFPIEIALSPVQHNNTYTYSAFIRDISERKLEQLNLKRAIKARDEFISVCSHELKTPITSMQLQFQLASKMYRREDKRVFLKENVIRRIENACRQLSRMNILIENMLDVSRISTGRLNIEKSEVDMSSVLSDVLETFREQLEEKNVVVNVLNKGEGKSIIFADIYRIEQVVANLITNALKYGEEKPIDVVINTTAGRVSMSVTDHGLGIDKENIERIFGRYERAIPASEISGLGLGLYISKQIIEAHNGKLSVKSEIGHGSTFTIEFHEYRAENNLFGVSFSH